MKVIGSFVFVLHVLLSSAAAQSQTEWTKSLKDRSKRGTLRDVMQYVRGDTGKWNDNARLERIPPIQRRPPKTLLDDWAEALREKTVQYKAGDDNWLLYHSQQLNDNDRLWIERIERKGNRFTIVAAEAVWKGRYRKNFTYHLLLGVNLGKLKPGKYEARWVVKPLEFETFEADKTPRNRRDNLPKNDRPVDKKPKELTVTFRVG